jgi:hypothetical protein
MGGSPKDYVIDPDLAEIARSIKTLPVVELQALLNLSPEQQGIFKSLNGWNQLVGRCFAANSFGYDDPIAFLAIGDRTDRLNHAFIWSQVYVFRSLWDLVQQVFVYLKKDAEEKGVELSTNAFGFFIKLITLEETITFGKHCQQFYEVNVPNALKEAGIRKKDQSSLSPNEKHLLDKLEVGTPRNVLLDWVMAASEKNKSSRTVRSNLKTFKDRVMEFHSAREEYLKANKRGETREAMHSYAFLDGQVQVRRRKP